MTETARDPAGATFTPSPGNPPPHPRPRTPARALPPHSTDSHCHVFGPGAVFPYAPDRTFTPVDAPQEQVAALQRFLGFERAVIVQSSSHGTDHGALLDALRAAPDSRRGVALVTPATSRAELRELADAGVCGARLHFLPHLGASPNHQEQRAVLRMIADMGWHAEIHVEGTGVAELTPTIASIRSKVVIDHMGRVDLREGLRGPAVESLLRLMDTGNVWVKVSGADRISRQGPPYTDAAELGALLVDHAPERVLFGTDYPHTNIAGDAPDDGLLVDLIELMAPTETQRQLLLVDNPAEFFGF